MRCGVLVAAFVHVRPGPASDLARNRPRGAMNCCAVVSCQQFGLLARPLCLPCFPALPGQSMFLEVVGAVDGLVVWPVVCLVVVLVVGLVVVVVLFVPVPPPPPPPVPSAKVVAAEAPTRAMLRTSAITCFILLFSIRSVPDFWQRSAALSVPSAADTFQLPAQNKARCLAFRYWHRQTPPPRRYRARPPVGPIHDLPGANLSRAAKARGRLCPALQKESLRLQD